MAQAKENDKDALMQEMSSIEEFTGRANNAIANLNSKIVEADASGDKETAKKLAKDLMTIRGEAESLQDRYSELDYILNEKPRLEKVQESTKKLREGGYREISTPPQSGGFMTGGMPYYTPPQFDIAKSEKNKKELISNLIAVPPEKIDTAPKDFPATQRATLGALSNQDSRARYMQNKWGENNVFPLSIDGDTEFVVRRKDGSVFTTEKKSLAGTASAIAVEVPIVASEIASFVGTLGATKSPTLSYLASGAARAGVGTAIDAGVEYLAGVEPQWFNAATRRGTEAAVSTITGPIVDVGTSKFLASRISGNLDNQFAQALGESATRLQAREQAAAKVAGRKAGEVSVPFGAEVGGPLGLESQQYLAGELPNAPFVGAMKRTQDTIRGLWDAYTSGKPLNPQPYRELAKRIAQNRDSVVNQIAKRANLSTKVVKQNAERQMQKFQNISSDIDELGKTLLGYATQAEEQAIKIKNETINNVFDVADEAGFSISPKELHDMAFKARLDEAKGGAFDNSAVKKVEQDLMRRVQAPQLLEDALSQKALFDKAGREVPLELQKEITELYKLQGPIDSREFDAWIRRFADARPDNAAGAGTKDQLGEAVANRMSAIRRDLYSQYETTMPDGTVANVGDLYSNATKVYNERMGFERNILGRILKQEFGEGQVFPREAVSAVMAEPAKIRTVLDAVQQQEANDPALAGASAKMREMMQRQYVNDLGFNRPGVKVNSIKYDKGFVNELWGGKAPAFMKSMDQLNKTLEKTDLAKNLTFEDIQSMSSVMDETTRRKAIKQIAIRLQEERKLENLQNKEIFKLAKSGSFENIDPDLFSKFILSDGTTINETKKSLLELGKMSQDARNAYKGDFVRELMNSFPGGKVPAGEPFTPMFDTEAFVKAMDAPIGQSSLRKKVEAVLGPDTSQFLYDLAKVNNANQVKVVTQGEPLRFTAGMSGVSFYLANGVSRGIRNRILAAALSSGTKKKGLLRALAVGGNSGAVDKAYREILKELYTTRTGLTALAHQAQSDEEFSNYLQETAKQFKMDTEELNKAMGEE